MSIRSLLIALTVSLLGSARAAEQKSFDSAGIPISYFEHGEGEPVILIHGFSANAALNWSLPGIVRMLEKDFRVIAMDVRGHGQSGKPHEPKMYGLEVVKDVTRLLDHLDIPKAHVVGYSMGAMITCKLLTTSPERLISATLGGAGWPRADDPRHKVLDELVESLEANRGMGPLLKALHPPGLPIPSDEQLRSASQMAMLINDSKALAAMMRGRNGLIVEEAELRKNRIPVLALIGDQDPLKSMIDPMVGVCNNLEVVVIEGADHMNTFTTSKFKESLRRFLIENRIDAASNSLVPATTSASP